MRTRASLALLALAALSSGACRSTELANRDPHGQRDVDAYIAQLESADRVRSLQVELVVEKLALPGDAVVGDLGCGPGVFSLPLARAVPDGIVYAADIEPRQLDRLCQRLDEEGVRNVVPILASAEDPRFPIHRLDLIFIGDTIHHFDDRAAYLTRLREALKPGGRIAILEYRPGDLPVGPPADHKLAEGELERVMTSAGYVRVASFDTHRYHQFEIWRVKQAWEP